MALRLSRLQLIALGAGLGGGLLFGTALILAFGGLSKPDSIEEQYPTWKAAHEAKLDSRGWLPWFVPRNATEIVIRSDPRTNDSRGSFHFPISEGPKLKPHFADMPMDEIAGSTPKPVPYDLWWPEWLTGTLEPGPRGNPGYSIHRPVHPNGDVDELLVACNFTKGHCLFWTDKR
ncbi:MAG: hypothetical protein ACJ790_05915 [Myxococcaceae bacterium]